MKKPRVQICRRRTKKRQRRRREKETQHSDLSSKNEEEDGEKKKKHKEETQQMKKSSNWTRRRTLGMNAKKNAIVGYECEEEEEVKLESLKLEFHVENMWIYFHISSHHKQIET